MNKGQPPQQHVHRSCCFVCGKFLTRPMVKIELLSITMDKFLELIHGVRISYGAQTKCRNCKKLRETLTEAKVA